MKLKLVVAMMIVLMVTSVPGFMASGTEYTEHAEILKDLGLFSGTNNGFELERAPKRVEVAAMLVKFLGAEQEANLKKYAHPFTDVPVWADNLVGYMYEKGLTTGIGNNLFGANNLAGARDYTVFVLKALGYDMTDFSYANTMTFAVQKGLISADEKSTLEGATFTRDEMVYLSYRSLFTDLKSGAMSLGDKLGKSNIDVVKSPEKVTVNRTLSSDGKYYMYNIDKKKLPAPFNEFVYFKTISFPWALPADMSVISYLVPGLKDASLEFPYDETIGYGGNKHPNTICLLYGMDKKLIGYLDLTNNTQSGDIAVEIQAVKPYVLKLPIISTGISLNSKGEVLIERDQLPLSMKNYTKALTPSWNPVDDDQIEFLANYSIDDKTNKSITTSGVIPVLSASNIVTNSIYVYLFDSNNNCMGYKKIDSQSIIKVMQAELDKSGVKDITSGMVYTNNKNVAVYPIKGELSKLLNTPYYMSVLGTPADTNSIAAAYYSHIGNKNGLQEIGYNGYLSSSSIDEKSSVFVNVYNKEKELLGYHKITTADLNNRPEFLKTITVQLAEPSSEGLHTGHFTVNYYINGVLDPASSRSGGSSLPILDEQGKTIAVELHDIFFIPGIGMEIKVVSNVPGITVKSFDMK